MTWPQWVYLAAFIAGFSVEMWAVFNDHPGDTITATLEQSPLLWVPTVVLCAWALGHFTLGVYAERVGGIAMLLLAPVVWRMQRPDRRRRN